MNQQLNPDTEPNNPSRADQLQFLRFLAFMLIFLWHADLYTPDWLPGGYGAANAVSFFIILSGFVSGYSSYSRDIKCSFREIIRYMWHKIIRVYPLYLTVTLFSVFMTDLPRYIASRSYPEARYMCKELLKHLLLIQSWFPQNYFMYTGVGWFLSTIMLLYLINIPLRACATRIRRSAHSTAIFITIAALSGLSTVIYSLLMRNTYMEFTAYVLPVSRIGEYVCGMALGYVVYPATIRINENLHTYKTVLISCLEFIALALWIWVMYLPVQDWTVRTVHWLLPNILLLTIFGMGKGILSGLFRLKPLLLLGNVSFECFLIHRMIIEEYMRNTAIENTGFPGDVFAVMICLITTVLAAITAHSFEIKHRNSSPEAKKKGISQ